jgi:hypothetical protein
MNENFETKDEQAEIVRNDYAPNDSTVVVEEEDRTVVLTDRETIVIEKSPEINIAPKNRPRRVNLGMWGTSEIIAVGLGMLSLIAAFLFYMFVVSPAHSELSSRKAERDRLQYELDTADARFKGFTTTQDEVAKLIQSVETFETEYLPVADYGRTALYQNLNMLIDKHGLINTSGPDYAPLEINTRQGQKNESERGRAKFQSLFPGVYVTMTVEGPYQNLRRFIRELETGKQFTIVSAVELEPTENSRQTTDNANNAQQQAPVLNEGQRYAQPNPAMVNQPGFRQQDFSQNPIGGYSQQTNATQNRPQQQRGKTVGETVSLRIELAAYFKRGTEMPFQSQAQQQ